MTIESQQSNPGTPSPIKRALKAMEVMQAKLDASERARREPIAIIGMGCRFPGGIHDADSFWQVLECGIDTIREVPPSRWDLNRYFASDSAAPGKMYTRYGGFVDGLEQFDAPFFHISPKEAHSLDPQQRLLLETAWEALENAGIAPLSMPGKAAGVFVGLCGNDYAQLLTGQDAGEIDAYLATGTAHSMAAGRISYLLGWSGPNLAVDTACSSGLTAVHLAIQSLRSGESELALAGAANCILTPHYSINFCKARMLAPDGRCKTFAADADGFVRGEGAGMIVLKRLSDAQRDGDRVLAVLRGSAMNQDGHTSGPTVPNGPAQQAVIRRALDNARVKAEEITYIEAHGTGTSLGDPIEAGALGAVFHHPLWVGSCKTNLGHLEGAAGLAGLLKVVLALQHRQIPANLHFTEPSPHIPWSRLSLRVPTVAHPWDAEGSRLAGISSFGFSGTNVHVIVEEAATAETVPATLPEREWHVLTISARTATALRELTASLLPHIEADLPNTSYTLNTGRSPFEHRIALRARDGHEAAAQLRRYLETGKGEGLMTGVVPEGIDVPDVPTGEWTAQQLQTLYIQGAEIDWAAWDSGFSRRRLALPTYPFQRRRHWYCDAEDRGKTGNQDSPQTEEQFVYEVQWQTCVLPLLPRPETLMPSLSAASPEGTSSLVLEEIESLSAQYTAQALALLDGQHSRVIPSRRRLFDRLLETRVALELSSPETRLTTLQAAHPEAAAELALTASCGSQLGAILTGDCDPLHILLPTGGGGLDTIYRDSPSSHAANRLAREVMERIVSQWPQDRPLRILEIGAGTGGTTAHLLDVLPADRTEYVFTDVSRAFLRNARERFAHATFVRYEILDIEKEPEGFAPASFDVIVAANVLHATADLGTALRHVRKLLAPGGLLLLLEVTQPQRWLDLTFGLLDGWWRFTDTEVRRGYPLLEPEAWRLLLRSSGFAETADQPACCEGSLLRQSLLLARADTADRVIWQETQDTPEASCLDLLSRIQNSLLRPPAERQKIWAVVRDSGNASQAALSAMGRVIGLEHPEIWGGIVHVSSDATEEAMETWIDAAAASGEKEVGFRNGETWTPRLLRKSLSVGTAPYRFRADSTYLITGGFGFLGLRLAKWMAAHGARNLVLMGRSGAASPEAVQALAVLRRDGVRVEELRADVSNPENIHRIVEQIRTTLPPLRGIVHGAGCGGMQPVASLTGQQVRDEFGPKVTGGWTLHEATLGLPLDFFVLFSSASSVWGAKGQAHYAAANACLDALAAQRRRMNLPALSINWGLLGGNMVGSEYETWLTRAGVGPLEPEDGFRALFQMVTEGSPSQAVIARVDWKKFTEVYEARERTGLFDSMERAEEPVRVEVPGFRDLSDADRRAALLDFVQQQFCLALGLAREDAPDPRQGFFDAGMDSLLAIEFKTRLQQGLGLVLPSTAAFNYPNADAMAAYLDRQVAPSAAVPLVPVVAGEPLESAQGIDADIDRLFQGMQAFLQEDRA